jgi:uncharacterized NAD(P)/FAD-binding protein YdhS
MTATHATVAIIGAGATGATLAIHLSRRLPGDARVVLIGDAPRAGFGLAYGAADEEHLLNVFAGGMSLDPDRPEDFVDWLLARRVPAGDLAEVAQRYVPRPWYGEYVSERLDEAAAGGPGRPAIEVIRGRATSLAPGPVGWRVGVAEGGAIAASRVALCLGNFPGRLPLVPDAIAPAAASRVIHDPWRDLRLREIGPDDDVLVLGTGLTMVDLLLTRDALGHSGRTVAVSRRGALPGVHVAPRPAPLPIPGVAGGESLADLTRTVREAAREQPWRQVIDGLRPHTQAIWQGWSDAERLRFQRLLGTSWGNARHRMAPEVGAAVSSAMADGRLAIVPGRLASLDAGMPGRAAATIRTRDGAARRIESDWVVNCTGPDRDLRRPDAPLLLGMLSSGVARLDPLRVGLDTDDADRVVTEGGIPWRSLHALGPITMGRLWEIVAMPDIRAQAVRVAEEIAAAVDEAAVLAVGCR